ncbi:SGNH/GDSL hydrolase family protein [Montanilutibacter psychrotolerans]|uniref:SGNH/GDSL hydrolase family protein n=1 Tax=Montanilutibacter psychrotolerans TaxID=1327343 RepID=A0A3M8SN59_9GAMM|nr:SGNH/GDSL hydrolase family protein [Lysobacter psychrotolerans]RNF82808.1 SGNH/GDSL hydrolase family protein [Lysobacter psychrotolerans]
MANATPLSWLALGDSYTIGEGVADEGRWPHQLAAKLHGEGIAIAEPRTIATTGWTTDELYSALDMAEPLGQWDFVSLLIGVNNQYRGRSLVDYRGEFRTLLDRAIGYARGRRNRVLVLSIPDWGVTPFAAAQYAQQRGRDSDQIAAELDAYNAAAAELCIVHGVAFVDVTAISRTHGAQTAMLADDGLHPSAAMYALWAEAALPVARGLLDAPAP